MAVSELGAERSSKKAGMINHVNINWIGASYQLSMRHMTFRSISIIPACQGSKTFTNQIQPTNPTAKTGSCASVLLCSTGNLTLLRVLTAPALLFVAPVALPSFHMQQTVVGHLRLRFGPGANS